MVFTADAEAHRSAMNVAAPCLVRGVDDAYNAYDWVPESSRSARGLSVYAALRTLGRSGVAALARRRAERLATADGVAIPNDVDFTPVLVWFSAPGDDHREGADRRTRAVAAAVQQDGTCWLGTTSWRDLVAIRTAVSNADARFER